MAATLGTYYKLIMPTPTGKAGSDSIVLSHTLTPSTTATDSYRIMKVGKGITFCDGFVQCTDVDTHATPTLVFSVRITDGTTTKVLIHQSTIGQAGGFIRPTKVGTTETGVGFTTDNKNYWVELYWDTGAATAASGTFNVGLTMTGFYVAGSVTE